MFVLRSGMMYSVYFIIFNLFVLRSVITGLAKDLIGKVDSLAFWSSDTSITDLPTSNVGAILVRN